MYILLAFCIYLHAVSSSHLQSSTTLITYHCASISRWVARLFYVYKTRFNDLYRDQPQFIYRFGKGE